MKFLSKRQVRELVLYSYAHIARLEAAGKFPKRVQLGPCRVGWVFGSGTPYQCFTAKPDHIRRPWISFS